MKNKLMLVCGLVILGSAPLLVYGAEEQGTKATVEEVKKEELKETSSETKEEPKTTESSVKKEETKKEETKKEETKPAAMTLPKELHGEWVADNQGKKQTFNISGNMIVANGVEYTTTDYQLLETTYTINWSEEAYIKKYGKKDFDGAVPFVLTYDKNKDQIISGEVIYTRSDKDNNEGIYDKYVKNQDLPGFLQDKWVATVEGQKIEWTIGARSLNVNGVLEYKIDAYGIKGINYSLMWDVDDYINRYGKPGNFNPQPIMFDYNEKDDTLVSGDAVFTRANKNTKEEGKKDEGTAVTKKDETKPTKKTGALPQTGEKATIGLSVVGGVIAILGSAVLIKKNN